MSELFLQSDILNKVYYSASVSFDRDNFTKILRYTFKRETQYTSFGKLIFEKRIKRNKKYQRICTLSKFTTGATKNKVHMQYITEKITKNNNITHTIKSIESTEKKEKIQRITFIIGRKFKQNSCYIIFSARKTIEVEHSNSSKILITTEVSKFPEGDPLKIYASYKPVRGHYIFEVKIFPINKTVEYETISKLVTRYTELWKKFKHENIIHRICKLLTPRERQCRFRKIINELISLNHANFIKIKELGNYYAKEKIDGERALLLFDKENGIHLVRNKITDPIPHENPFNKIIIIDGEIYNNDMFQAFDIIYYGRPLTRKKMTERLKILKPIINQIKQKINLKIKMANYHLIKASPQNFFEVNTQILENQSQYNYNIDGIIYAPDAEYYSRIYKWKPVDHLTIDFMVHFEKLIDNKFHYQLYLFISAFEFNRYNLKKRSDYPYNGKYNRNYFPIQFTPQGKTSAFRYVSNEQLENDKVYEFRWNKKWECLRLREDRIYSNNYKTGMTNWFLIQNPITVDNITGETELIQPAQYFTVRDETPQELQKMIDFHTSIKWKIYKQFFTKNDTLFDIGTGRMGDLNKWNAHTTRVSALDPDEINIKEGRKRYSSKRHKHFDLDTHVGKLFDQETLDWLSTKTFTKITSFYSIHYILTSTERYTQFIELIKTHLEPQGKFICITFDGREVLNALKANNGLLSYDAGGTFIIRPKNFTVTNSTKFKIGQMIEVYIESIGTWQTEYLVDINYLLDQFQENGFRIGTNDSFERYYTNHVKTNNSRRIDPVLKRMSFLYHLFYVTK